VIKSAKMLLITVTRITALAAPWTVSRGKNHIASSYAV